jgi:regulator of protease activity HflC (stomatin/prohibitin superfamily)
MDDDGFALAIGVAIILLAAIFFLRAGFLWFFKKRSAGELTVMPYEAGVKMRAGAPVELLHPGRYHTWPAATTIQRVDLRQFTATVAGQEVLTADQMSLRVSAIAAFRVVDPKAYVVVAVQPTLRLHEEVQLALRRRVGAHKLDDLLSQRTLIETGMAEEIQPALAPMGMKVESVSVRDLTLTGPAKAAFADLWRAQKEGLAALERARGEQAALRALNNAARMLKGNPELMNLRLLQAIAGGPGKPAATVVLGGGGGLLPVSNNSASEPPPSE